MIFIFIAMQMAHQPECHAQLVHGNGDSTVSASRAGRDDLLHPVPVNGSKLQKLKVFDLDSHCSMTVRSFLLNSVVLADGSTFRIPEGGGNFERFKAGRAPDFPLPQTAPRLNGHTPIRVAFVGYPKRFVGIWPAGDHFVLAAFSETSTRPPTVIATMDRPVESLFYETGPHEGFGGIEFILRGRGGTAKLVRYRWDHDGFKW